MQPQPHQFQSGHVHPYPYNQPYMYYPPMRKTNWAAIIAGFAALGVGSYAVYWLWQNGYFDPKPPVPPGCTIDGDCQSGYVCNIPTGKCVPAVDCINDEDCPDGYNCINGNCISNTFDFYGISHWCKGDQIQGVLGGVTIKIKNLSTNTIWETTSNAYGEWSLEGFPQGNYSFEATKTGYHQLQDFAWCEWTARTGYYPGMILQLPDIYTMMDEYFSMDIDVSGLTNDYTLAFTEPHYINHIEGSMTFDCGWGFSSEYSEIQVLRPSPHSPIPVWNTLNGSPQSFNLNLYEFGDDIYATGIKFIHDCIYLQGTGKGLKSVDAVVERIKI